MWGGTDQGDAETGTLNGAPKGALTHPHSSFLMRQTNVNVAARGGQTSSATGAQKDEVEVSGAKVNDEINDDELLEGGDGRDWEVAEQRVQQ